MVATDFRGFEIGCFIIFWWKMLGIFTVAVMNLYFGTVISNILLEYLVTNQV